MAPIGTLWGRPGQRQTKVILSVAAINGFELAQPDFSFYIKPAEFTAKFSYGKIPTFEGTDGFNLSEGAAIARYLSSIGTVNLLGSNAKEVALVDQWTRFSEQEIGIPTGNIMGMIYEYLAPFNLEDVNGNTDMITRALNYLESHLAARPSGYVALDTLSLADLVLAGVIYSTTSDAGALGAAERAKYPHVFAHYTRVTSDERVKRYWGTEQFVDVRITEPKPHEVISRMYDGESRKNID
ncbi:glutathione S-transferase C-terminal-like protein [Chiua virens]|nr:glutathione S-transferase C-terminal-like protein [Chiua virens]